MKKLIIIILLGGFLASCQKESPKLSCSPEINEWAKEMVKTMDQFNRESITALPLSRQRAVYRGLSAEAKCALWRSKLELVEKESKLSNAEFEMLRKLYDQLEPSVYSTESKRKEFREITIAWENSMRNSFGWDEGKIFFYACTWMSKDEFEQSVLLDRLSNELPTKGGITPGDEQKKDCNCYYSIYCQTSGLGNVCDESISCNEVPSCGILGTSNCTGRCN